MQSSVSTEPLSGARGCVGDVARLGRGIPLFPVDRTMRLAAVADARHSAASRIGWAALFTKAYARVAREMPELRTWVAGVVRPRLATADTSVATLAISRVEDGVDRLCWARIAAPDALPLAALQRTIDDACTKPVAEAFPRQLELERTPGPLRRAILRWNMRSASPKRTTRIGTFSLSTLAGLGATNRFHPTLCTTSLSYAPLEADGRCVVTVIADHRVLDGAAVARALHWLEQALVVDIVAELASLGRTTVSAAPLADAALPPAAGPRAAA
jgi:hypothetical protein